MMMEAQLQEMIAASVEKIIADAARMVRDSNAKLNAEGRPTSKVPCGIRCAHPEGCSQRQRNILGIVANDGRGPRPALLAKGVKLEPTMLEVQGHRLQPPRLQGAKGQDVTPNNYSNTFQAVAPPEYNVPWACPSS